MQTRSVRIWIGIHKWTSLVCTFFLLILCTTGLPLIFHEDIDRYIGASASPDPTASPSAPLLSLDRLIEIAKAERPGEAVRFATAVAGQPLWNMEMGKSVQSMKLTAIVTVDSRTGKVMRVGDRIRSPAMQFLKDLHTELFLEEPGMLFLGAIGLCFIASIVSGVAIYGPFMRRLDFGEIRTNRRSRLWWLDLHNLTGITLTVWMLVVGATGVMNTLSQRVAQRWLSTELVDMIRPWKNLPPPTTIVSAQLAMKNALAYAPGMSVSTIAMPGSAFAGTHHYDVFLKGDQPLTSKLIKPVLINAEDGTVSDSRSLPFYAQALFISRPLHFGDYGGMPLKIIWALLDFVAIFVLISGLYLWCSKFWRSPLRMGQPSDY